MFVACHFTVCIFFGILHGVLCSQALQRGAGEKLSFSNFVHHRYHYLNATKLGSHSVHKLGACGFTCINTDGCFSFNIEAAADVRGHFLCEILASDKYNQSDGYKPHPDFHHYSIPVSFFCSLESCYRKR